MSQNLDPHLSKICSFTHKCHVASKDKNVWDSAHRSFPQLDGALCCRKNTTAALITHFGCF